ncbi:antibiotic biosynthesis monooxygenase [Porticoccaceae bacterium LTM1]|nr:antibiotic biosynthesis monooxygenase [Porticoccaceae bacterium LTM1]
MITRIFKATISPENHREWQEKVEKFSIPWLKSQPGLVAYYPGRPLGSTSTVFSMISIWESFEALKSAVGEDYQVVVLLEDEESLVESVSVEHFEFFDAK